MEEHAGAIIEKLGPSHLFWLILALMVYKIIGDIVRLFFKKKLNHKHMIKANLQIYNELTKRMFSKIKDNARSFCRKNGFDRLTHRQFKEEIKEFSNECMDLGLQEIEEHYDNDIMIIPFHITSANLDRTEVYLDVLSIMDEVREISVNAKEKMCNLQEERVLRQKEIDSGDTNSIVNLVIQYVTEVMEVKNSILRDQMNLIEDKLELMRINVYVSFRDRIKGSKAPADNFGKWMAFKDVLK